MTTLTVCIMNQIISEVLGAFEKFDATKISYGTEQFLKKAITGLKDLSTELDDNAFKREADIIIVGTIICMMVLEDRMFTTYLLEKRFNYKYLYPQDLPINSCSLETIKDIGNQALIQKTIPFTGSINYVLFPGLKSIGIDKNYFSEYALKTDWNMDTTQRSQTLKDNMEQMKKQARLNRELRKWESPFSASKKFKTNFKQNLFTNPDPNKISPDEYEKQSKSILKAKLLFGAQCFLVFICTPFLPSLLFTIPWITKKKNELDSLIENPPIKKLTFTLAEYEEVRNIRKDVKKTLLEKKLTIEEDVSKREHKPRKRCIALDRNGVATDTKDNIVSVVMYCDSAQAKRWSPAFLKTGFAENTQNQFVEEYKQSTDESKLLRPSLHLTQSHK